MEIPRGHERNTIDVLPMESTFVERTSWNAPIPEERTSFLTLDFHDAHTRFFYRPRYRFKSPERFIEQTAVVILPCPRSRPLAALIQALESEVATPVAERDPAILPQLIDATLRRSLLELEDRIDTADRSGNRHWDLLVQYIDDRLDAPLDRTALAEVIAVHPNHLSRIVRAFAPASLPDYINQRRMAQAALLLQDYRLSIKEIAARCGFTRPNYFSRRFREHFGMSPAAWRADPREPLDRSASGA